MGLIGDLKEVKTEWKNASLGLKIVTGISFFFAISSIASLSNVIFSWKGFILDAINFYEYYIALPVKHFLQRLGLHYKVSDVNYLIVSFLILSSILRLYWFQYRNDKMKLWETWAMTIFLISVYIIIMLILNNDEHGIYWGFIPPILFFILFCLLYRFDEGEAMVSVAPIILAIITILILGAINSGLLKTS